MDKFAYIAANAARNTLIAQGVTSHNLANVNTTGFKADLDRFSANPVYGPGAATRVYAQDEENGYNAADGSLMHTENPLDLGLSGEGWFAVQNMEGELGYTRRGDFRQDANGTLINGDGHALLGAGGSPINLPPFEAITVANDGTITIQPAGATANELAVVDRVSMVSGDGQKLVKGRDGLFREETNQPLPESPFVSLRSGSLESSNVNAVDSMVQMIEHARAFQVQVKLLDQAEQLDNSASNLLSAN
ncbi:MAG: flagellar basal body rod protein FlgF [Gammaproteobacteria bacterium]|nr:flagellar basal body rod protein FlgF [Gammaproteobacteria bacterium]